MSHGAYLDATQRVLTQHGGLWFRDECFVVSRGGANVTAPRSPR